jgi:hypothetical protein
LFVVTSNAAAVLRDALALSVDERADIAAELLASLDPGEDAEAAGGLWAAELERRARRAISDGYPGEDWTTLRQRLADELAE